MNLMVNFSTNMKSQCLKCVKILAAYWKLLIIVIVPLVFLPLALQQEKEAKCGFVICLMTIYWTTEALPLPITSLIPIVLFPLFGILSTDEVCKVYFKETNVLFLAGVIMAIAVEHCNLHKRVALKIIIKVGYSPPRLILGFMITTMFLSMWISNAAATAIMVPTVSAVLDELKLVEQSGSSDTKNAADVRAGLDTSTHDIENLENDSQDESGKKIDNRKNTNQNQICYFLGVAYAANIGGTGTITGTPTNLSFKGILDNIYPQSQGMNFATWMEFNIPLMLVNTLIAWLWLQIIYLGLFRNRKAKVTKEQEKHVRDLLIKGYENLGPMTYHEYNVLFLFILDILLWFFRNPEFINGWSTFFPEKKIKDATSGIAIALLLFILPAKLNFLESGKNSRRETPALLSWKVLSEKIPLGIILLLGGGFAISTACEKSGLSNYLGEQLEVVKGLSSPIILLIVTAGATFATELSSNTAIANIMLPVLAKMCSKIRLHPLYLMLPCTIACSYAFMLPVATAPNAIVLAAANMKPSQMIKAGFVLNLLCICSLALSFIYIGVPMYDLNSFPDWADIYSNDTMLS